MARSMVHAMALWYLWLIATAQMNVATIKAVSNR